MVAVQEADLSHLQVPVFVALALETFSIKSQRELKGEESYTSPEVVVAGVLLGSLLGRAGRYQLANSPLPRRTLHAVGHVGLPSVSAYSERRVDRQILLGMLPLGHVFLSQAATVEVGIDVVEPLFSDLARGW